MEPAIKKNKDVEMENYKELRRNGNRASMGTVQQVITGTPLAKTAEVTNDRNPRAIE